MASHLSSNSLMASLIYWAVALSVLALLLALALVSYSDLAAVAKLP